MPADAQILQFPQGEVDEQVGLKIRGVSIARSGVALLNDASLTLNNRGVTGLIGPNGAGKSLLLRAITGLVKPDVGRIEITHALGQPAFVFQKPVLLRRSVKANIAHALRIAGVPRRARTGRLAELLVSADLSAHAESPARQLSGGEQQRLAFARALAADPKLLLLDEPTASLDPNATAAIENMIRAIAAKGIKVIFVTHDRAQARRVCDDIAFLHKGHITEHSSANAFFDTPTSTAARQYIRGELVL